MYIASYLAENYGKNEQVHMTLEQRCSIQSVLCCRNTEYFVFVLFVFF